MNATVQQPCAELKDAIDYYWYHETPALQQSVYNIPFLHQELVTIAPLEHDLIDDITLHIMPVALPLFAGKAFEKRFTVERTKVYESGAIETVMTMRSN